MVGYVGSHGVHGTTQVDDVNIVLADRQLRNGLYVALRCASRLAATSTIAPRRGTGTDLNGTVGRLPATFFRNSSVYNGLEVQLTKQM